MSKNIVPTISSGTPGPLGILHLPRLWQKASLGAADKLHPDYPACGQGYDQMVLDALGLDREALLTFVKSEKPTYVQFERYIIANATKLNQTAVSQLNAAIIGYQHEEKTRATILETIGYPEGKQTDAINLNNLDDWHSFHSTTLIKP